MPGTAARITAVDGQSVGAIHDQVRTAILRGELPPGQELSQVRLARELGISRTPLREALRMLLSEGLLEARPNQQMRVAGYSIHDMEEIYVSRVTLEATAIRITIPYLSGKELAQMEGFLAQMSHFAGEEDYEGWEVPHRQLHRCFHARAGERVIGILTQLSEYAERYRRAYTTQADRAWVAGLAEHRRIVDACRERDPDAGARALVEHLAHTAIGVIELVDPKHDPAALKIAVRAACVKVPATEEER